MVELLNFHRNSKNATKITTDYYNVFVIPIDKLFLKRKRIHTLIQ